MEPTDTSDPQPAPAPSRKPDLDNTEIDLVVGLSVELARHACDLYGIDPHRAFNVTNAVQRLTGTRNAKLLMVTTPDQPVPIEWAQVHAAARRAHARTAIVIIPPPD